MGLSSSPTPQAGLKDNSPRVTQVGPKPQSFQTLSIDTEDFTGKAQAEPADSQTE